MSNIIMNQLKDRINKAKLVLQNMSDGEISPSAYDTGWVARIPNVDGTPMFPQCLQWLQYNQHEDGSWGSNQAHYYHDQLVSTLSAIIALKTWNMSEEQVAKGVHYIYQNISNIDNELYATVGFEIIFTAMLKTAQQLGLDLPYEHPILRKIEEIRKRKLERIPIELVYGVPTTLLHSLEGLEGLLDEERVLAQQAENGSFLNSPSATAYIYIKTGNKACLRYIQSVLERFGDCVPVTYPLDLFERLWVLNNLYELGIEHYFDDEIEQHLKYVQQHFTSCGVPWSRYVQVPDIDNTSVAFKLLRLRHKPVSAEVFERFYDAENKRFFCFSGELDASLSHTINLYQAAQLNAHEEVLDRAELFAYTFLKTKQAQGNFADKWLIWEHLGDQVDYLLANYRFETAPTAEKRLGRELVKRKVDRIHWIDKVIYYLPNVNAQVFLDVALAEQALHEVTFAEEYEYLSNWANQHPSIRNQRIKPILFTAYNLFPKPEQSFARLILCKITLWVFAIDDVIDEHHWEAEQFEDLVSFILEPDQTQTYFAGELAIHVENLVSILDSIVDELVEFQGDNIRPHLYAYIEELLRGYQRENLVKLEGTLPTFDEYLEFAQITVAVRLTLVFALYGMDLSKLQINFAACDQLLVMASDIARIFNDIRSYDRERDEGKINSVDIVMQYQGLNYEQAVKWLQTFARFRMRDMLKFCQEDNSLSHEIKTLLLNVCRVTAWMYKQADFHEHKADMRF